MTNIAIGRYERRSSSGEDVEFYYTGEHLGRLGLFLYWVNFSLLPAKLVFACSGGLSFVLLTFAIGLGSGQTGGP